MKFILGKKKEMTQIFTAEGNVTPVTIVVAPPCPVVRIKHVTDADGYSAVAIGLPGEKKLKKRELGQTRGFGNLEYIREFRTDEISGLNPGDQITVDSFAPGDIIKVTGTSKGKGFQGVVRRHSFHGHSATHGTKDQERSPGSIGPGGAQRVFPGMRMAGHMGSNRVTVKNLEIVKIDHATHELFIKGAIPGSRGSLIIVTADGELKVNTANPVNSASPASSADDSLLISQPS